MISLLRRFDDYLAAAWREGSDRGLRHRAVLVRLATSESFLVRFWFAFALLTPVALLIWWLA